MELSLREKGFEKKSQQCGRMNITCISDLHGFYPTLPGGDLLIVAGDCSRDNKISSWADFFDWFEAQKYRKKILVAGNHDDFAESFCTQDDPIYDTFPRPSFFYLCDSGTEFEGLKIWGMPWTTRFKGMNPRCTAFTVEQEKELEAKISLIPGDVDILVTHGPAYGVLDEVCDYWSGDIESKGSLCLRKWLESCEKGPLLHVFGHIHEGYGREKIIPKKDGTYIISVNASHVNELYKPVNNPVTVVL